MASAAKARSVPLRQRVRLAVLFFMVLAFPILLNYFSVFIIIEGSSKGIMVFSFFWSAWVLAALASAGRPAVGYVRWGHSRRPRTA